MSSPVARDRDEISLLDLLGTLLRHRWLLLIPLATALAAAILLPLRQRYIAESSFVPEATRRTTSQLAGLASQLGFNVSSLESAESEEFYVELLKSRELRDSLALTRLAYAAGPTAGDSVAGVLSDLLGIRETTPLETLQRVRRALNRTIDVRSSARTRIVRIRVASHHPALAEQVNRRMLLLVNRFNLEKRQLRAAAERRFVEDRAAGAEAELRRAESELEHFLTRNRRYQDAPELVFEAGRLQRQVEMRQTVFQTLSQAYEQSRIDEVRNTPLITIIDSPEGSSQPKWRWKRLAVFGFLAGSGVTLVMIVAAEHFRRQREARPEEYRELKELGRVALKRFGATKG